MHHVSCRVVWWKIQSPRWLTTLTAQIWRPVTSGFSQNQNHFRKGRDFTLLMRFRKNMTRQLMVTGITVWGPKVPTLEGTEPSLSYVQCFLYLVSSSINVSYVFHITRLDTFWTALVYEQMNYVILILQTLHKAKADSWVPRQCPHAHLYSISIFLKNNSRHLYSFSVAHWKSTNVPIKNVFDYKQQKIWLLVAETDWVAYFSHIGERCLMVFVQWLSTTMSWLMTQILLAFPSSSQMVCEAQDYHLCIKR